MKFFSREQELKAPPPLKNYFLPSETQCKCGCGFDIQPELREVLNEIRRKCGFPLRVTSGARCDIYNATVGGARNSLHKSGLAADILWPKSSHDKMRLLTAAFEAGISGLGIYPTFVHIDLRHRKTMSKSFWINT